LFFSVLRIGVSAFAHVLSTRIEKPRLCIISQFVHIATVVKHIQWFHELNMVFSVSVWSAPLCGHCSQPLLSAWPLFHDLSLLYEGILMSSRVTLQVSRGHQGLQSKEKQHVIKR
jgi:hypothetical protein